MFVNYRHVLTLLFVSKSFAGRNPPFCSGENLACSYDYHQRYYEAVSGVPSIEECRQLCEDSEDTEHRKLCSYFTYYGKDTFPFTEVCFISSRCDVTQQCSGCVTEARHVRECNQEVLRCGSQVTGLINTDNLLDVVQFYDDDVDESDCQLRCQETGDCSFFTLFISPHPHNHLCFLLTSLQEPVETCDHCVTGPAHCNTGCSLRYQDQHHQHLLITDPGVNISVPSTTGHCHLRLVAVGGGGHGFMGGGGSGYVQFTSRTLTSSADISVSVGGDRESSVVMVDGEVVLEAGAGLDGGNGYLQYHGGDGYSGGGQYGELERGYNGGTDGGNGEGEDSPGLGSTDDLSLISLNHYKLSPGAAGLFSVRNTDGLVDYLGGGGGGVLVDGQGPQDSPHQGQGYGGGGSDHPDQDHPYEGQGAAGVVIIEISSFP